MNPSYPGGAPYRVPPEPNRWRALTFAAVMHAGLFLFLWAGVRWQNTAPVAVEAEVWDVRTQTAAPPPPPPRAAVEPTPTPPPKVVAPPVEQPAAPKAPDINLERAKVKAKKLAEELKQLERQEREDKLRDEKLLKDKADLKAKQLNDQKLKDLADKKLKDLADKQAKLKKEADDKKLLDKTRDAEMRRITGAAGTSGTAPKATAPRIDSGYVASLTSKIKSNIAYSGNTDVSGNPTAVYKIDQLPTGEIILVKRIKSSGIPAYDNAVENAIAKSSPLPKKKDGTVERSIEAVFEMKDLP